MEEAECLENLKYLIAFNSICYRIKGNMYINENSKRYINLAKEFFQIVTKSLDSILDSDKEKAYHIAPHLSKIINNCGKNSSNLSSKDVEELKDRFSSIPNKLDNLKTNPNEFYKTKDSEEIFNLLSKLIPIYNVMIDY
jgi:hypothetical protein